MRATETTKLATAINSPATHTERAKRANTVTPENDDVDALLRLAEVEKLAGIKRTCIRRLELAGAFPRRITLGPRCVRWRKSEVLRWVANPIFV